MIELITLPSCKATSSSINFCKPNSSLVSSALRALGEHPYQEHEQKFLFHSYLSNTLWEGHQCWQSHRQKGVGARTLLGAPGHTTWSKKLLGTKCIATRNPRSRHTPNRSHQSTLASKLMRLMSQHILLTSGRKRTGLKKNEKHINNTRTEHN